MMKTLRISHIILISILAMVVPPVTEVWGKSIQDMRNNCFMKPNETTSVQENSRNNAKNTCKIYAELRSDVELECPVTQVSLTQYEWYKINPSRVGWKRMTQFRGRYELSSQGQVKIRSLKLEDSGIYVCKLSSSPDSYSFELVVSGNDAFNNNNLLKSVGNRRGNVEEPFMEPQIIREYLPKEKTYPVPKGSSPLHLKCESKGNPKPTITWSKDDKILSSSQGNMSSLKLMNLTSNDNGLYKCESENIFGISVYEVSIQVIDAWHGSTEVLELSPINSTVHEGGMVNISCVARFESEPYFFWLKKLTSDKTESGKKFFHIETNSSYKVLPQTTVKVRGEQTYSTELVLTNVTGNDTGLYVCAVAGRQGYNFSETTVIVESDQSHLDYTKHSGFPAQWAILWTSAFLVLVILIILVFVRIYGCHSSKSEANKVQPLSRGKTMLPERSPQTMSTHCTSNHLQHFHQNAFVPLMVGGGRTGSCTLSSRYQEGRDSSDESFSPWQSMVYVPRDSVSCIGGGSQVSRDSTLLADLEVARSYCNISNCSGCSESEIEYDIKPPSNRSSYGYCSANANNGLYQSRRSHNPSKNFSRSKPISSVPLNSPCSQSTVSSSDCEGHHDELITTSHHYMNNPKNCESNVYQHHQPKRKHRHHHNPSQPHSFNPYHHYS